MSNLDVDSFVSMLGFGSSKGILLLIIISFNIIKNSLATY